MYALLLTPQGKILYDFFITKKGEEYILDIPQPYKDEILKKLRLYKLRARVDIADLSNELVVLASFAKGNELFYLDPRNSALGYRGYINPTIAINYTKENPEKYIEKMHSLLIPDLGHDLKPEKFFPLELGFDKFNAVDYLKGCYVGQEVIARTRYRGVIRKQIYKFEFVPRGTNNLIQPGTQINKQDRKIGEILSVIGPKGLALLRIEEVESTPNREFEVEGIAIKII
ncbi:folate-binding protein YgfZ [Reticulomyxa filosa]|uniref:Folate-binding protein YgfZ n=1 Tax=Reticulomyxa filosa TaxID=46433 RepID=X6NG13_RETFI|nr:folate-binding protein YgfZ [Reticulomyxa filosa]|eukprot:ETO24881.1 folate-binding protein YgfZ [Reticulomyxa filosa]